MGGHNYYLLAALPPLGEMGSVPPLRPAELLAFVGEVAAPRELLDALFLGGDLVTREAHLVGESEEPGDLAVLTPAQVRNEAPLPDCLVGGEHNARRIPVDSVWAAYFRHAHRVARRRGCSFLRAWVGYEVALRNAIAAARARALDLEVAEYLVVPELADPDANVSAMLNEWSAASTPLAGLRALDTARWAWATEHDGWFSYTDDEITSYGAKLMLLDRWHRLARAEAEQGAEVDTGTL